MLTKRLTVLLSVDFFASYEVGEFENRKFEGIVRKSKS